MFTQSSVAGLALLTLPTILLGAGDVVICDDFNDNSLSPIWSVIGSDLGVIAPVEQNSRLELPAEAVGGDDHFGGIISLSTLDAFVDFKVTVDYVINTQLTGEVGLSFAVVFDGDLQKGILNDGAVLDIGTEPKGDFACASAIVGGGESEQCGLETGAGTSMYFWYDAANDVLYASYVGFDDPNAVSAAGLRETAGTDRVSIAMVGFVAQHAPAVPGSDHFFDEYCVVEGVVIPPPVEGDVNEDGTVDVLDLLLILGVWGPCADCAADLNADGFVDILDLLILLGNWG